MCNLKNEIFFIQCELTYVWLTSHFRDFVFSYFGHFSCVIFFTMYSVLDFCLAHLALQMHTQ